MLGRLLVATSIATSLLSFAGSAHAGVITGEIQRMDAGAGIVHPAHPVPDPFTDIASIAMPTVGSFILIEASVPGSSAFNSGLEFDSIVAADALFSFSNGSQAVAGALGPGEFAFAASRLVFSSTYGVAVTLVGNLTTAGEGFGFFDFGGDVHDLVPFGAGGVSYTTTLGPGQQTIAWGSIVGADGGSALFTGTLTLTLVPGPGGLALLAIAGALTGSRRATLRGSPVVARPRPVHWTASCRRCPISP